MQKLLAAIAVLAIAACSPQKRAQVQVDLSKKLSPGCYTVDLFDPYRLEYPEAGVPAEASKFLGVWKNGAWGGHWCHDLYITKAYPDGTVDLLDAYGPNRKSGDEAVVFKRKGKVENGVLTFFSRRQAPVSYRIVDGYLLGERIDAFGKHEITMSRERKVAIVPIPPVKPSRRS